ncbi:hypothetical protein AB0O28_18970 [Microbispora sp. NPDC088329]|uniref:hypothetical protein n=1 Tax=Microbispora sp. NPDC088329 TaxID=3154869 RepID=UPI003413DD6C
MTALPPYSGEDVTCPKCGNEGASTRFLPYGTCAHGTETLVTGWEPNERLHRECTRCGHAWDEQTREQMCKEDPGHLPASCRHCLAREGRP